MSDQDFFFDEDEQPQKATAKSSAPKKGSGSSSRSSAPAASGEQSVTMTVAALIAVIAVLVGMIAGIFVGRGLASSAVPGVGAGATIETGGDQPAPQLTPEQLQGGDLPEGHPPIGEMTGGGSAEATASEEATKSE